MGKRRGGKRNKRRAQKRRHQKRVPESGSNAASGRVAKRKGAGSGSKLSSLSQNLRQS